LGAQGEELGDVAEADGERRGFMRGALRACTGGLTALAPEDDEGTTEKRGLGCRLLGVTHGGSSLCYLLAYRLTDSTDGESRQWVQATLRFK